jgi:calcineurin-like phosphoesterase family protein
MPIALAGDVHGALDALYERIGAWERRSGRKIELVLQAGDLGAFGPRSPIDKKTRKRAEDDPTELGVVEYIAGAKTASHETWFVRGNHEDFDLLAAHADQAIDPAGRIRHLAGGKVYAALGGRLRIAAIGGIQPRKVNEPGLAKYVQAADVGALLALGEGSADLLLSHDGPIGRSLAGMGSAGSVAVYDLLKTLRPRWHFFGHYDRPLPPFELFGCRCVCLNQPGPARIAGRDGAVAVLDLEADRLAWIEASSS